MPRYVVLQGLTFKSKDIKDVNDFFEKHQWGRLKYVLQFKTLPGWTTEGGRNDIVFEWNGTDNQLSKFAMQRFIIHRTRYHGAILRTMGADMPYWLEDYIDNNKPIIPEDILKKLQTMRER